MESFINLMGGDRWSSTDISNRFKSLRDSKLSPEKQALYSQIMLGHITRQRTMTAEEAAKVADFAAYGAQLDSLAVTVYIQAALLDKVLDFEQGLNTEPLTGDALDLWSKRNPASV